MSKRDPNCIFCKIVAGEIPCHRIHEDEQTLAFLDIGPLSRGHALVIPKDHYATLDAMPGDAAAACMRVVPRLARAICEATGAGAWNLLQNNGRLAHQAVDHVHLHIIPRYDSGHEKQGLNLTWSPGALADDDAAQLRERIGAAIAADDH